jgi:SAM-dependent methyltransferase
MKRNTLTALVASLAWAGLASAQEADPDAPPFIATPFDLAEEMLDLAGVAANDVVYDLGSGDGRLVIAAARRGARGVGIEYDGALVEESRATALREGVAERVAFHHQDLFESRFEDASVVLLYLGPVFNLRLRPMLFDQLAPGSRVVSHGFHMGDWEPDSVVVLGSGAERANLYHWVIPAAADGFWSLEVAGAVPLTLELLQRYQTLSGSLRGEGRTFHVRSGRLRGSEIGLELHEEGADLVLHMTGVYEEGRLSGVVAGPSPWGGRSWSAVRFTDPSLAPF